MSLSARGDEELLEVMPKLVALERTQTAEVIQHLLEIDRRRLYLDVARASLASYCIERLGYSEDEASKRVRVTRLARRFPAAVEELRAGHIHLTGLVVLSPVLTEQNAQAFLSQARGKTKRQIEQLVACVFPRPDVRASMTKQPQQLALDSAAPNDDVARTPIRSGAANAACADVTGTPSLASSAMKPLSAQRWAVQFTAGAELREKLERCFELLSHVFPRRNEDLPALLDRALDALLEKETRRRFGAGNRRTVQKPARSSRYVARRVVQEVWTRDEGRCTFHDADGQRCTARRFITLEHRYPYALGGAATVDNLCLLCAAHNARAAREVFGAELIEQHIGAARERSVCAAPQIAKASNEAQSNSIVRERVPPDVAERARPAEARSRHTSSHVADVRHRAALALRNLGFREALVFRALERVGIEEDALDAQSVLKSALALLVPERSSMNAV